MSQHKTVSVNGVEYDAHSGMPLEMVEAVDSITAPKSDEKPRSSSVHAKGIHHSTQRSGTLNRDFVKKAQSHQSPKKIDISSRPAVQRSPHIAKFAPAVQRSLAPVKSDVGPTQHPAVQKAHAAMSPRHTQAVHSQHQPKPAQEIKHTAISEALANAHPTSHDDVKKRKTGSRAFNVASASLAVLLMAGYFTYLNMPNLSVRVAAAQAGIDASYPEYRPIGYRLDGPVAYRDGEVSMKFASNSNTQTFALNQAKSGWDSSALLSNYVTPKSNGEYATYSDAGLTIYTYGNNAAWVNGGVMYTVQGSATLSNEQIRRIATSM